MIKGHFLTKRDLCSYGRNINYEAQKTVILLFLKMLCNILIYIQQQVGFSTQKCCLNVHTSCGMWDKQKFKNENTHALETLADLVYRELFLMRVLLDEKEDKAQWVCCKTTLAKPVTEVEFEILNCYYTTNQHLSLERSAKVRAN